jgi:hypothetical protein
MMATRLEDMSGLFTISSIIGEKPARTGKEELTGEP